MASSPSPPLSDGRTDKKNIRHTSRWFFCDVRIRDRPSVRPSIRASSFPPFLAPSACRTGKDVNRKFHHSLLGQGKQKDTNFMKYRVFESFEDNAA